MRTIWVAANVDRPHGDDGAPRVDERGHGLRGLRTGAPADGEPGAEVAAVAESATGSRRDRPSPSPSRCSRCPRHPSPKRSCAAGRRGRRHVRRRGRGSRPTIASLAAQDYPALSVLVLDNATDADPTARIAAALPTAFVRRLPENVGFAGGRERGAALGRGRDVPALLPRRRRARSRRGPRDGRGGVPLERGDRRAEARRLRPSRGAARGRDVGRPLRRAVLGDRAGRDRPGTARRCARRLLRVARDDARARRPVPRARRLRRRRPRPAPTTSTCVGAPASPARACSSRPPRRVRHRQATAVDERRTRRQSPAEARAATRSRVRVLFKSYSRVALLWVLPSGFVLTLGEAIGLALTAPVAARGRGDHRLVPGSGRPSCARRARATQRDPPGRRRRRPRPHGARQRRASAACSCSGCTPATASPTRRTARGSGWRRPASSCGARPRSSRSVVGAPHRARIARR